MDTAAPRGREADAAPREPWCAAGLRSPLPDSFIWPAAADGPDALETALDAYVVRLLQRQRALFNRMYSRRKSVGELRDAYDAANRSLEECLYALRRSDLERLAAGPDRAASEYARRALDQPSLMQRPSPLATFHAAHHHGRQPSDPEWDPQTRTKLLVGLHKRAVRLAQELAAPATMRSGGLVWWSEDAVAAHAANADAILREYLGLLPISDLALLLDDEDAAVRLLALAEVGRRKPAARP